ncbi:MAG: hypothetical protein ACFFGZ_02715 [Candidatus Thorarchaeota archaeon]
MKKSFLAMIVFAVIFLATGQGFASPAASLLSDPSDDVVKVSYTGGLPSVDPSASRDEIDITSIALDESATNVSVSLSLKTAPVFDDSHVYWVVISFTGTEAMMGLIGTAGAWFWVGGYEESEVGYYVWVFSESSIISDPTSYLNVDNGSMTRVEGSKIVWETPKSYWGSLSNTGSWWVGAWAWYSDVAFSASATGSHYWDYAPNDESPWEAYLTDTETGNGNGDGEETSSEEDGLPIPGFTMAISLGAILSAAIIIKKRKL